MSDAGFEKQLASVIATKLEGKLLTCEQLSGGASQETYCLTVELNKVEAKFALRRAPPGRDQNENTGRPGISGEISLIRAAFTARVPVPEIILELNAEDDLGEGFIMRWLDGDTLGSRIVRADHLAEIRPELAYQCGQALARIHGVDLHATRLDTLLQQVSPEESVNAMWETYKALSTPQPMIDYTAQWLRQNLPDDSRMALVHSDFRNGNLMIDTQGVRAVLDWELAHIGDPMRDLGWICTNSWRFGNTDLAVGGFGERQDLYRGYEDECGIHIDEHHVKFWEVFGSFWWAIACLGMADSYRNAAEKSVERPGIARRTSECQIDCVNLLIPGQVIMEQSGNQRSNSELPRVDELVGSVGEFLRDTIMQETSGRTRFMARVAANSLDIAQRDLISGPQSRATEKKRLLSLPGLTNTIDNDMDAELDTLRWKLVEIIRSGEIAMDHPALVTHLRTTVANQLAIDQPRYSGLKTALLNAQVP